MTDAAQPLVSFIVAGGASPSTAFAASLARADRTLYEVVDGGFGSIDEIPAATVAAARGEYIVFASCNDRLYPDALPILRELLSESDNIDVFYSDEIVDDRILRKPEFSPERLRTHFYFGHFVGFRASLVRALAGLRAELPGARLYDLALRATRIARRVATVPVPLIAVTSRDSTPVSADGAGDSVRRALEEHLAATGGGVVHTASPGISDTRRLVAGQPLVSIVIPTRGDSAQIRGARRVLVTEAVRGVIEKSTYPNFEIVVIVDDTTPASVIADLQSIARDRLNLVPWSKPFSFSGKMNLGVVHSRGEYVMFLNDDVELITADWVEAMLALAQRPNCGIVGALLYFEDGTIQHAGQAYYAYGVTHIGIGSSASAIGPGAAFLVEREVDGVTAACALMSRSKFFEVGGFSTLLPGNFNDVDLCMKLAVKGYQAYVTPHARLYHFESKSRDSRVAEYEVERAWGRWEPQLSNSQFWPEQPGVIYPAG